MPQVLAAAERRRAVLRMYSEDFLAALWVHPEDGSRKTVQADNEIADPQTPDRPKTGWRKHGTGERLGAAAHEGQRGDLDHAALEVAVDPVGVEHVVERVEQRPQVWIDLGLDVARQEAEPLARLD